MHELIHDKLPERLKSHDQSYTTRLLAPSLFANYSFTKRTHTLARLSYMQDESTNNIHLLHKKVGLDYILQWDLYKKHSPPFMLGVEVLSMQQAC